MGWIWPKFVKPCTRIQGLTLFFSTNSNVQWLKTTLESDTPPPFLGVHRHWENGINEWPACFMQNTGCQGYMKVCWSQVDKGGLVKCITDAKGTNGGYETLENIFTFSHIWWNDLARLFQVLTDLAHIALFSRNTKTWCFYIHYDPFPKEISCCIVEKFFSFTSSKLTVCSVLIPSLAHTLPFQIIFS